VNVNSNRIREHAKVRRGGIRSDPRQPFDATEDWYEPTGKPGYRVIVKKPGTGYRHVVTREQVKTTLSNLPSRFIRGLEVVQLGCMTRKKNRFPCYGMQWGCSVYLYPFDESLEEEFDGPPPQALAIEARMFGARVVHTAPNTWKLIWTETSARDFQLNNVLVHEIGHLNDGRNSRYTDMERYAEWFAIRHGYLPSGGSSKPSRLARRKVRRRHHGK
jgi:hypothetical protein